jgi:hypothetical protein
MKCPKCNGRTVIDDVHTYMGRELERRCLLCGRRYPIEPVSTESTPSTDEAEPKQSKLRICPTCNKPASTIIKGECATCYARHHARVKAEQRKTETAPPSDPSEKSEPSDQPDQEPCETLVSLPSLPSLSTETKEILQLMATVHGNQQARSILEGTPWTP